VPSQDHSPDAWTVCLFGVFEGVEGRMVKVKLLLRLLTAVIAVLIGLPIVALGFPIGFIASMFASGVQKGWKWEIK